MQSTYNQIAEFDGAEEEILWARGLDARRLPVEERGIVKEIFGPVGLAAAVFKQNINRAIETSHKLQVYRPRPLPNLLRLGHKLLQAQTKLLPPALPVSKRNNLLRNGAKVSSLTILSVKMVAMKHPRCLRARLQGLATSALPHLRPNRSHRPP